ncbi:serine/threonine-protein kinase [Streptomyces coffeae]|uniref:non-specific serine/threonine protein kinase n=1 Tax=Streptomyces coffeae TaxID=621382 RepID=A0ABS1NA01_9ACTN|nr:serine/threonine-protein kinase [Streptomyces coffeae]MBL1096789.1 tetratricopeptide repeat protein [Streptomyces coffeae]
MADTRLIQGRYRLLDLIGRGGMGEVWRARDEALGRRVAVKCLKPLGPQYDQAVTGVLRERFRREARVAAALQHRGVTVVHDFGEDEGVLFLVMELLEGRNLGQLLDDNKHHPLPVPDVLDIAGQVAAALAYTHQQGIVHRDLKPANIMRLADGSVKLCDFGIARPGQDIGLTSRLTGTGVAMGTPHYMSPEQIVGGAVDHRSDLYSLGCVLYELATGAPPFDLGDAWAILVGHRDTPPAPPRRHRPELPERFERVVLDLLAKTPERRPRDASDLAERIAVARTARFPAPGGDVVRGPGPRLPAWALRMTIGSRAGGPDAALPTPADPPAALTGAWTGPHAVPAVPPGPPAPPGAVSPGLPVSPDGCGASSAAWAQAPPMSWPAARHAVPADGRWAGPPAVVYAAPPGPPGDAYGHGPEADRLGERHQAGLRLGWLGRWQEAAELHRAVAAERERLLGPDHRDTLASRYEMAFALGGLDRPGEALRAYAEVAAARERVLGPGHPDTLAARQETAFTLGRLGHHTEAHGIYTAVLATRERTMGAEHPDTLRCRHNLAFNLGRLGRHQEAHRMACEVAAARTRVLGAEHPDTLVTRSEVAYALGRLDRWEEALSGYREVAAARTRTLGPDHPDTFAARYEVGISLGRLHRAPEALMVYRALVADRTRAQGPSHPETLRARHGLGVNLGRLGRWSEALAEAREVCALRERALGPDHPDTLVSEREVAVALGWLGLWSDALAGYRRVARARTRVLGPSHPDTVASRMDEAHCLEQLDRHPAVAEPHHPACAEPRAYG